MAKQTGKDEPNMRDQEIDPQQIADFIKSWFTIDILGRGDKSIHDGYCNTQLIINRINLLFSINEYHRIIWY